MIDIETLAARHDIPLDAARHLQDALTRGGGRMAQFNHPALGGMGQWHDGGMLMIGDMFNDALKARVGAFLRDLAPHIEAASPSSPNASGWPVEFGAPASSGSQNDVRYAVFPAARRLVIVSAGASKTYDTGDHIIGGVSQQQGSSRDLSFTSQNGTVRLSDLKEVSHDAPSRDAADPVHPDQRADNTPTEQVGDATSGRNTHHVHLDTLERLAELHRKGVLTDDEFGAKKAEILSRL